jgi:DNA replication protein DnaC
MITNAYRDFPPIGMTHEDAIRWERQQEWESLTEGRERYRDCRLANYHAETPEQRDAVEKVRQYILDLPSNVRKSRGILLHGPVGTGKDHLASAVLRAACLGGMSVAWTRGTDLSDARWEKGYDLVGLSDPAYAGVRRPDWQAERITAWLDSAYNSKTPVVCTVNAAGKKDLVEMLGPAAADRLLHGSVVIKCNWPSHRQPA